MPVRRAVNELKEMPAYVHNGEHLADELRELDLLLRRWLLRSGGQGRLGLPADPQLFMTAAAMEGLLAQADGQDVTEPAPAEIDGQLATLQAEIDARVAASRSQGIALALPQLAQLFGLSVLEVQAVVICLAPELRRKYDRIYAYVQDDIARQKPSVDLVLELLCASEQERWAARTSFTDASPLMRAGILQKTADPSSPSGSSGLGQFLSLNPRILGYLLGSNDMDSRLAGSARLRGSADVQERAFVDAEIERRLQRLIEQHWREEQDGSRKLVIHIYGPDEAAKEALADQVCDRLGCPLLTVDLALLLAQEGSAAELLRLAYREALLLQSALYLRSGDDLLEESRQAETHLRQLAHVIAEYGWLTFLASKRPTSLQSVPDELIWHAVTVPAPNVPLRRAIWTAALQRRLPDADPAWANELGDRFALTAGQIRAAAELAARDHAGRNGNPAPALADLYAACRRQSSQALGELALKIEPHYTEADLVLPNDKMDLLREIQDQVTYRQQVLDEWGFGAKYPHGAGLSVLFSGSPGTGKTMAAEVIAGALKLDLYKIDLSAVVNKYVGETEKNLERIFSAAESSNAILFFDEADALFGKRTQIGDAHDRYANIEVSYLLQRMERYEGVVILATNLRENMDEAFARRIRFIVDFPFPDAASRTKIWDKHIPPQVPGRGSLDFGWLGENLALAGGNIRNIALHAAYRAAADEGSIQMQHVLHSARREYAKISKTWNGDWTKMPVIA